MHIVKCKVNVQTVQVDYTYSTYVVLEMYHKLDILNSDFTNAIKNLLHFIPFALWF